VRRNAVGAAYAASSAKPVPSVRKGMRRNAAKKWQVVVGMLCEVPFKQTRNRVRTPEVAPAEIRAREEVLRW